MFLRSVSLAVEAYSCFVVLAFCGIMEVLSCQHRCGSHASPPWCKINILYVCGFGNIGEARSNALPPVPGSELLRVAVGQPVHMVISCLATKLDVLRDDEHANLVDEEVKGEGYRLGKSCHCKLRPPSWALPRQRW